MERTTGLWLAVFASLKHTYRWAVAAALMILAPLAANAADAGYTDRIIVKYRSTQTTGIAKAAQLRGTDLPAARMGLAMRSLRITAFGSHVLKADRKLTQVEAERLAADIEAADPNVEYAEPDYMMHVAFTPNDPRYNEQWNLFESTAGINAPAAWDKSSGSGVVVAVLDTGYRPHTDLAANILQGYDFVSEVFTANDGDGRDTDARDPGDWAEINACGDHVPFFAPEPSTWHGTHVAGIIAARTHNSKGVAGVAYNAKIVPARVLGKCGGLTSDIADAVLWAAGIAVPGVPANANPAKVINISLGHDGTCSNTMQIAIDSARARGASVIVAAGNYTEDSVLFTPANCNGVVGVTSVNRSGGRSDFSNFGMLVKLAAPGGERPTVVANDILSTMNTGATTPGSDTYLTYHGTSMAAPTVSGVVALMLSVKPTLKPDDVTFILQSTTRQFPSACSECGAGIVNARAAVDAAMGSPPGVAEVGPNDSIAQAQAIANANTIVNAAMSSSSDSDYTRVSVPGGRTLSATLIPNPNSDYDVEIYDSSGTLVASARAGTGVVDIATVRNFGRVAGNYYVRAFYYSGGTGNTNGKYALRLNW
jgi:serine protease